MLSMTSKDLFRTLALALLAASLAACTARVDDGDEVSESEALALANPDEDQDLKWVKENGFESTQFMATCVSRGEDGSVIDTAPLPVGGSRHLECTSYESIHRQTTGAASVDGERWCVLGQVDSYEGAGDARLTVEVTSAPEGGPWTVRATSSAPIEIEPVEVLGLGQAWPVWIRAVYRTVDLQPEQEGKTCEEVFGG